MARPTIGAVIALAGKDLRLLWRDRVGFFFVFGFPLMIAVFFGLVFSGPQGASHGSIGVAVVDADGSERSASLARRLHEAEALSTRAMDDLEAARSAVVAGNLAAAVVIEQGFGEVQAGQWLTQETNAAHARVRVLIDPARTAEAGLLRGVVTRHAMGALLEGVGTNAGRLPVDIAVEPAPARQRNAFLVTFPQGLVWGVMACAAGFGVSIVTERRGGTLARLRSAPTPAWSVLAGKAVACFVVNLCLAGVLLAIGALWFGLFEAAGPAATVMAVVSVAIAFVGLMMLLACAGKTEAAAGGVGWAALLVLAMIGGAMAPRFLMPPWLDAVGGMSPVRWAIEAYEGALWRGWTLREMLSPCARLVGLGSAAFVLGASLLSRRG
ncbi:MAG: ABC transporter permease [Planctomycetota bacterium]